MAGSFQQTMRKYERGRDEKMNFYKFLCIAGCRYRTDQEKIHQELNYTGTENSYGFSMTRFQNRSRAVG